MGDTRYVPSNERESDLAGGINSLYECVRKPAIHGGEIVNVATRSKERESTGSRDCLRPGRYR